MIETFVHGCTRAKLSLAGLVACLSLACAGATGTAKSASNSAPSDSKVSAPIVPAASEAGDVELTAPYEPTPGSVVSIMLETTPSQYVRDASSVYTVLVTGDGSVWYLGERNVGVVGEREAKISAEKVRRLLSRFAAADFFSLSDRYAFGANHQRSIILTLSINGCTKRITHYGPDSIVSSRNPAGAAHDTLNALAKAIAIETGASEWVNQ